MIESEYLYDGSFEGLLTTFFYCYPLKSKIKITNKFNYKPNLLLNPIEIPTEIDKFNRVYSSIRDKLSSRTLRNIYYLYLSDLDNIEDLAFKYLKLCYSYGDTINSAKTNDIILDTDKFCRRVSLEAHRFTGFVRFKKITNGVYYATIEPDHNILPIISNHFTRRFSDQEFIIHDLKRNIALVYNKKNNMIIHLSLEEAKNIFSSPDDIFDDLWKIFYTSTNIKERKNPKLQKSFMPSRYWKHLVEVN